MEKCSDCLIGFLGGDAVYEDTIKDSLDCVVKCSISERQITVKELTDGRKGYLDKFKYCPSCGHKINWSI